MSADAPEIPRRASWLELFFDLVLVAAVGALGAWLHDDHSVAGLGRFALLFVPVWWSWWGFTWYSAAFNDDDTTNRLALLTGMLGVAALAAGAPNLLDGDPDVFVLAYAGLFALLAALYGRAWRQVAELRPLSARYGIAYATGAALWAASLLAPETGRTAVWVAAMLVLMAGPVLAAASTSRLSYDPEHIAERYGLFTLIVLGESVVAVVGGLEADAEPRGVLVAVLGLPLAAAIWWLYFDRFRGMPLVSVRAGFVWAQGHLFVFAGIAAAAVGVELLVEAAAEDVTPTLADRLPLGAGVAAFGLAMAAIRAATRAPDRIVALRAGAAAVVLAIALAGGLSAPACMLATAAVVVLACAVDLRLSPPERPPAPLLPHRQARRRPSGPA